MQYVVQKSKNAHLGFFNLFKLSLKYGINKNNPVKLIVLIWCYFLQNIYRKIGNFVNVCKRYVMAQVLL